MSCSVTAFALAAGAAWFIWQSLGVPPNSPQARMYRTESDLTALREAITHYQAETGAWPPPGQAGLEQATALRSRRANYFPDGPPRDAWGQPFYYVPHSTYDAPQSDALRDETGAYFAPDMYQLYSAGADGDPQTLADNIVSWDARKGWRPVYKALQRGAAAD